MELLLILSLVALLGVAAALGGADSRDGADWEQKRTSRLPTEIWHGRA